MTTALEAFLTVHDQYLEQSQQVYATGETAGLEPFLAPGYHGHFGTRRDEQASFFSREESLEGMVQTGRAYPAVRSGCEHRQVRMPSDRDALVFFGKQMDFGNGKSGYAYVLEVWRQLDGAWRLVRETVETA